MSAYFFDSSAAVKRYTKETGTSWILTLVKPSANNALFLVRITGAEVIAALTRQLRSRRLTAARANKSIRRFEREFTNRYTLVEVDSLLVTEAMNLAKKHGLRGYDAVQLAAAIEVHSRRQRLGLSALVLISADIELNNAALAEGLVVDNPNNHP